MEEHFFTSDAIHRMAFVAMTQQLEEYLCLEKNCGENMRLYISKPELHIELNELAKVLAFSYNKRIESFLKKNMPQEEEIPSMSQFRKYRVGDLKEYVARKKIPLPRKGSGKNRRFIKKDYLDAIRDFHNL